MTEPKPWSEKKARQVTEWTRKALQEAISELERVGRHIRDLYVRRGWAALGYESWDEFVEAEFGELRDRLTRADIRLLNVELTRGDGSMSVRAAAAVTGSSPAKVARDAARAKAHEEVSQPETPTSVVGRDGKTYRRVHVRVEEAPEPVAQVARVRVVPTPVPVAEVEFEQGEPEDDIRAAQSAIAMIQRAMRHLGELPPRAVVSVISEARWRDLTTWSQAWTEAESETSGQQQQSAS